jgi:hypothetical protein
MHWDLEQCVWKPGEKLRDYIQRFSRQYTACPEVPESKAIDAFFRGNKNRALVNRLGKRLPETMKELMDIAVDEAMGEEAEYAMLPEPVTGKAKREEVDPGHDAAGSSECRDKKKKKIKQGQLVAAAEPK